jgi:hypothetical protein
MGKTGSATLVAFEIGVSQRADAAHPSNDSPSHACEPSPALGSDQRHDTDTQEGSKGIDFLTGVLGVHLTLLSKDAAFQRKR